MDTFKYKIAAALNAIDISYRPNPLPIGIALEWIESKENKEGAFIIFESLCKSNPELIAGFGWKNNAERILAEIERAEAVKVEKPSNEKSPEDLQKDVMEKKKMKAVEPRKKAPKNAKRGSDAATDAGKEKPPEKELSEDEQLEQMIAEEEAQKADGEREIKYMKGGKPVYK